MYSRNLKIGAAYKVLKVPPDPVPLPPDFSALFPFDSITDTRGLILHYCPWASKTSRRPWSFEITLLLVRRKEVQKQAVSPI